MSTSVGEYQSSLSIHTPSRKQFAVWFPDIFNVHMLCVNLRVELSVCSVRAASSLVVLMVPVRPRSHCGAVFQKCVTRCTLRLLVLVAVVRGRSHPLPSSSPSLLSLAALSSPSLQAPVTVCVYSSVVPLGASMLVPFLFLFVCSAINLSIPCGSCPLEDTACASGSSLRGLVPVSFVLLLSLFPLSPPVRLAVLTLQAPHSVSCCYRSLTHRSLLFIV